MKPIFTIGFPHWEAAVNWSQGDVAKDIKKDYHVITHTNYNYDKSNFSIFTPEMNKHKINAKKYGRI